MGVIKKIYNVNPIGKKYSYVTIIGCLGSHSARNHSIWVGVCLCGNFVKIENPKIRHWIKTNAKSHMSCGCHMVFCRLCGGIVSDARIKANHRICGKCNYLRHQKKYRDVRENRERERIRAKLYRQKPSNKLATRLRRQKRRAIHKSTMGKYRLTRKEAEQVFQRFGERCFNCGRTEKLTLDHHYPVSCGGGLTRDNTVLLCVSCNSSKQDKPPEDFYSPEQLNSLVTVYGIRNESIL